MRPVADAIPQAQAPGDKTWEQRYAELARQMGDQAGIFVDVAAELAAEIHRREAALSRARALEEFAGKGCEMAHDLNNVMQVVLCSYDRLVPGVDQTRQARALDLGRQAADRGAALTQDLLTFARHHSTSQAGTSEKAVGECFHRGGIVLLADEDQSLRKQTAGALRGLGYQVVEAATVATARALSYPMFSTH